MVKTIIFDMGGVIITLDNEEAQRRFEALGVKDLAERMDPYKQVGIFGDLEEGKISEEEYRKELGRLCGRELTFDEVKHCWMGFMKEVSLKKLHFIDQLRAEGYRVLLLSNTNPYVSAWTDSEQFTSEGRCLGDYFDALYRSFEVKYMKPDENFFRYVLGTERLLPEEVLFVDDGPRNVAAASELGIRTFCPQNGDDWTEEIRSYLQ